MDLKQWICVNGFASMECFSLEFFKMYKKEFFYSVISINISKTEIESKISKNVPNLESQIYYNIVDAVFEITFMHTLYPINLKSNIFKLGILKKLILQFFCKVFTVRVFPFFILLFIFYQNTITFFFSPNL